MGVDLARFERQTPYEPWRGDRPVRLVSCGRLNPIKGHQELIEAVGLLRKSGFEIQLNICGEDEQGGDGYHLKLQEQIDAAGLAEQVTLLGAVSEDRVQNELETSDVFVLASHHEPLGVAIMEAMAMSLPVLTTDAGGVPELVDHGRDGLLVKPKDPKLLADTLTTILRDPELACALAAAGRAKIQRSFHAGVSAQAIAEHMAGEVPGVEPARAESTRIESGAA